MSRGRKLFASKKDATHDEIANRFRELGCSVVETNLPPVPGFPDLIVGCIGANHLVEAKNLGTDYGRKGFNENQTAFNRDWRGEPVELATCADDASALVQKWRARAKAKR